MISIKIKNDQAEILWNYAQRSSTFYFSNKRSKIQVLTDVYLGKSAEYAFKLLFKNRLTPVYFEKGPDPGYDFILDNIYKIDIKALKAEHYSKIYFDFNKSIADIYVVLRTESSSIIERYDDYTFTWTIVGFITKDEAKKFMEYDSNSESYFLNIRYLQPYEIFNTYITTT